jgi:hypothetical protein
VEKEDYEPYGDPSEKHTHHGKHKNITRIANTGVGMERRKGMKPCVDQNGKNSHS